jgi:hypothetical protein
MRWWYKRTQVVVVQVLQSLMLKLTLALALALSAPLNFKLNLEKQALAAKQFAETHGFSDTAYDTYTGPIATKEVGYAAGLNKLLHDA